MKLNDKNLQSGLDSIINQNMYNCTVYSFYYILNFLTCNISECNFIWFADISTLKPNP